MKEAKETPISHFILHPSAFILSVCRLRSFHTYNWLHIPVRIV